jgi:hypothetical protein
MDSVPFNFDAYGGFGRVQGLARLDEHGLELQFRTSDALFGVLKTGPRTLRVPLETLLSVRFSAGWFWMFPVIELRVRDLAGLQDLPGVEQGRVRLSLAFQDRHDGRAFAADLELLRARRRILQLDRTLDRMAREPAPSMPAAPGRAPAQRTAPERKPPQLREH